MTTTILIHQVQTLELKEPSSLVGNAGVFWTRKLFVIDIDGHRTEITLFAATEEQLKIEETT